MADAKPARKTVARAKVPAVAQIVQADSSAGAAEAVSQPQHVKEAPMNVEAFPKPETVAPAFEQATADVVAKAQAAQAQMAEKLREMMEKNMKTVTEMTEFAKGNVEAMIESAKAAAAGAETLTTHFVESSKKNVEEAQAAFKAMTSAKTPNELMQAQNDYARAQFDKAVANMSHLSETWLKLAGEVVQPLSNRMALASETVKKTMAV